MTGKQPKGAILAAGGTGGHMFPAQALAQELIGRDWRIALITDRRGGELPATRNRAVSPRLEWRRRR